MALISPEDFLKKKGGKVNSQPAQTGIISPQDFLQNKRKNQIIQQQDQVQQGIQDMNASLPFGQQLGSNPLTFNPGQINAKNLPQVQTPPPKKSNILEKSLHVAENAGHAIGKAFTPGNQSTDPYVQGVESKTESLPVVGPVFKFLDQFSRTPAQHATADLSTFYTPGATGANIAGFAGAAENALTRALPDLVGTAEGKLATKAITGAAVGAPLGAGQYVASGGTNLNEAAKSAAMGATLGGSGDAALNVLGEGAKKAFQKLFQKNNIPEAAQQELLALPAPKPRGNVNTAQTPDVISGRAAPTIATKAANPYRQKWEQLVAEAHNTKFTPGREYEELQDMWSRQAGPNDPSLDELLKKAYPSKNLNTRLQNPQQALKRGRLTQAAGGGPNVESNVGAPVLGEMKPQEPVSAPKKNETMNVSPEPQTSAEPALQAAEQKPRIRDQVYNYLDKQEQAARQRLAARKNRLSSTPFDTYADYAIIGAAKLGKGTINFTDWSEEMVKEFGEKIRPQLDKIYIQSKERVRKAERMATQDAQEAMKFNEGGGDASTFDKKISWDESKNRTPLSETIQKSYTQMVDDMQPLANLEKQQTGKIASAEKSLYKSGRLYKGVPEKANQYVQDNLIPILQSVEKTGKDPKDLARYALAVHAKDVNAAGYKSGFTNKEIQDVIDKLGTPDMEAARQKLVGLSNNLLQMLADNGVISQDLLDTLRERWKNYMPLFRSFEDDKVEFTNGLSKALGSATSPIKALKGSEKQVVNPFHSMVKNIFQSVTAAEKNVVDRRLAALEDGEVVRRLGPNEDVGRKNVVSMFQNGEKVRYEVPPEVYKAMKNLDQESSNMLIKVFQAPASLLRAGATLTPEFSLRNPMRDVVNAYIVSNSGFNPITDFGAGLIQAITKGKLYKQWVDDLGAYGSVVSMDRKVHAEALRKVLQEKPSQQFVNIVKMKPLMNLLRAIADTSEAATKVGEYRAALRSGATPQEAAYRSRDLMDFSRAGTSIRQTNKIIAFLNANIQGKDKLIRAIKRDPIGVTSRAFKSVTLPTVAAFLAYKYLANPEQQKIISDSPNWLKDSFWLLPVPGTNQVARIPKPFDLAPIFSNLPERALDFAFNKDKSAFDSFAQRSLGESAIPIQLTGLLPLIEGMANYSFFRQGPIIPERENNIKYQDQQDVNTTETAKALAGVFGKLTGEKGTFKNFSSPRIIDNTITGLTAGLGTYATSAVDAVLKGVHAVDRPSAPAKDTSQLPLARAFLVNKMGSGQSMDDIYSLRDELTRQRGSDKLHNQSFPQEGAYQYVNSVTSQIGSISSRIREIQNSRQLSANQKRDQIKELNDQRNLIAQEAMARLRKVGVKP